MAQVLVRDLDPAVVERLKRRARQHGRSLQREAKAILEQAAETMSMVEARQVSDRWHRRLQGVEFEDSAEEIRADHKR
jgi:plasmid stability protein